jgi:hypothetical protein
MVARILPLFCVGTVLSVGLADRIEGQEIEGQEITRDGREILTVRQARVAVTPLLGVRAPLVNQRRAVVVVPGALAPVVVVFDGRGGDGGTIGAEVELRLLGPVGLAGALTFSNPDEIVTTIRTPEGLITHGTLRGPSVVFARGNLLYELPAPRRDTRAYRPAAHFMIGPALVREDYGHGLLALFDDDDRVDNFALHAGVKALMPFGSEHLLLHLSVENYATFWNPRDQERRRVERLLDLQPGAATSMGFDYNTTHVLMFNLGLSLRL